MGNTPSHEVITQTRYILVFLVYLPRKSSNLVCNDETNTADCDYDGGDCCLSSSNTDYCSECVCNTTGVIMSPKFPSDYANDLEVSWLILVASGQVIEINFISFDVEDLSFDVGCYE